MDSNLEASISPPLFDLKGKSSTFCRSLSKSSTHVSFDGSLRFLESQQADATAMPMPHLESSRFGDGTTPLLANLTWKDLTVTTTVRGRGKKKSQGKVLLSGVTGFVRSGQLVALMGASGAGKTTLLNCLLGRNSKGLTVKGKIKVNGRQLPSDQLSCLSAYVQQDDLFIGNLTVREHLTFQGALRLDRRRFSGEERRRRVEDAISDLGLSRCQNTLIGVPGVTNGGISGGERKRLAFASELLTSPAILFCDEPTSGLDSHLAESVVRVLESQAYRGMAVLCSIHQPASQVYDRFSRVLLLAKGRVAFLGNGADEPIDFFRSLDRHCPAAYNPADFYFATLAEDPDEVCDAFLESEFSTAVLNAVDAAEHVAAVGLDEGASSAERPWFRPSYATSCWNQFVVLFYRALLANYRNRRLSVITIAQKVILGLFVGLLYPQVSIDAEHAMSVFGALFFQVQQLTYPALFGVMNFLTADFPLLVREHHNRLYSVLSFYVARTLSLLPIFAVDGALFITISYWMIGLPPFLTHFLLALLCGVLVEQSATAFGTMLSATSSSLSLSLTLAAPVLTVMSLTGGLFANTGALPTWLSWTQYLSWFRYGFEAFSINTWTGQDELSKTNDTREESGEILESLSFSADFLFYDLALLLIAILLFYSVGFVGLLIRVRRAR